MSCSRSTSCLITWIHYHSKYQPLNPISLHAKEVCQPVKLRLKLPAGPPACMQSPPLVCQCFCLFLRRMSQKRFHLNANLEGAVMWHEIKLCTDTALVCLQALQENTQSSCSRCGAVTGVCVRGRTGSEYNKCSSTSCI